MVLTSHQIRTLSALIFTISLMKETHRARMMQPVLQGQTVTGRSKKEKKDETEQGLPSTTSKYMSVRTSWKH